MVDNMFSGMFGKVGAGMCRLTMNGGIAVKCSNGKYKTYNVKKGTLTNVTSFCFNIGDEFFFVIPTNKVSIGDIIMVEGRPKCVIESDDKTITVIDYETSEIRRVVPERHIFMGKTYFYGKIVSLFGNFSKGGSNNFFKMMMMSQLMGSKSDSNILSSGGFGQMLGMSMLMGGKDNMFGDMFSGMFDSVDDLSIPIEEEEDK